ncbi:hypothetical protein CVT25_008138 [Psilocybe cyanescens]|uniref:HAM1-like N-terminal domain-containing protein n=1 Tax=Psilocybe cyanescens TaxID=93625 RepID=A0A409XSQ3_PSICY|nr:hypothetical protein CVT25_008138 [Psilocybe cyanescens]
MDYCLPCFGKSNAKVSGEREPLLPKHVLPTTTTTEPTATPSLARGTPSDVERPIVDKVVDVLVALNAGKLPTQDQISHILQALLKSELLREDKGKIIAGNGPTSKQGRKVLGDVKGLVQAALRFGLEKNADNKLQELYFQITSMEAPVEINANLPAAGQTALDATKSGANDLEREMPTKDQLAFDAATFFSAVRTIAQICITSPIFRLILNDLFAIVRDIIAHAAGDVGRAALQVQHAAQGVEEKARSGDDIIGQDADGKLKLDSEVKEKGKEVTSNLKSAAGDLKKEWDGVSNDVADKTKEKILERDQASRSAMRSILILVRKYAEKVSVTSEVISATLVEVATETKDALKEQEPPTYPPQPYAQPQTTKPILDVTSENLLRDFKEMSQRLARGHSLDGLLSAFGRVVRDLNDVPAIIADETHKSAGNKGSSSSSTPEPKSPSPQPLGVPPAFPGKSKKNKKARKKQRALQQASPTVSPAISPSQSQDEILATPVEEEHRAVANPFRVYLGRVGAYLDQALDEPGWAMSGDGAKALESLFDDGVELVNVVGESVIDVAEDVATETDCSKSDTSKAKLSSEDQAKRRFKTDIKALSDEVEAYVSALENDKTTMGLVRAFEAFAGDFSGLVFQGAKQSRPSLMQSIAGMHGWTAWIGWAIPRLLRILPTGAVPIPSIEAKTDTMEGALQALFVQGIAKGSLDREPVGASLVPDEVVLKRWTEVKIDMAEDDESSPGTTLHPGVQTTSRLKLHMDGVRARVEEMGYYFKYKGGVVGYEDEGVISVDVGMGAPHAGIGVDIEVEMDSNNMSAAYFDASESASTKSLYATSSPTSPNTAPHDGSSRPDIPEIIIDNVDDITAEEPANIDVQTAVAPVGAAVGRQRDAMRDRGVYRPTEPLFRVVDVSVAIRGLRFRIDQSRHWILNKLFLQPLAGPVVARLVKQAVEEKVRQGLDVLALGLGEVVKDAKLRGEARRGDRLRERIAQGEGIVSRDSVMAGMGLSRREMEEEIMEEDGVAELLGDWWSAVLHTGPTVLGRVAAVGTDEQDGTEHVETRTSTEATAKGLTFTSTTSTTTMTTEEPHGVPAMVYHPATNSMERVDMTMNNIDSAYVPPQTEHEEEETVQVAIGAGSQLFPGKAGPYDGGASEDRSEEGPGLVQGIKDIAHKAVDTAVQGTREGVDAVQRAEERWDDQSKKEQRTKTKTWKSKAFDF